MASEAKPTAPNNDESTGRRSAGVGVGIIGICLAVCGEIIARGSIDTDKINANALRTASTMAMTRVMNLDCTGFKNDARHSFE